MKEQPEQLPHLESGLSFDPEGFVEALEVSSALGEDLSVITTPEGRRKVVQAVENEEGEADLFVVASTSTPEGIEVFDPEKPEILVETGEIKLDEERERASILSKVTKAPREAVRAFNRFLNKKDPTYINRFVLYNGTMFGLALASEISRWGFNYNPAPHADKISDTFFMNGAIMQMQAPSVSKGLDPLFFFKSLGRMLKTQKVELDTQIPQLQFSASALGVVFSIIEALDISGNFDSLTRKNTGDPWDIVAYGVGATQAYWTNRQLVRRFQEGRFETISEKIGKMLEEKVSSDLENSMGFGSVDDIVEFVLSPNTTDEEKQTITKKFLSFYKNLLKEAAEITRAHSDDIAGTLGEDTKSMEHYNSLVRHFSALVVRSKIKSLVSACSLTGLRYWKSAVTEKEELKEKALHNYRISL